MSTSRVTQTLALLLARCAALCSVFPAFALAFPEWWDSILGSRPGSGLAAVLTPAISLVVLSLVRRVQPEEPRRLTLATAALCALAGAAGGVFSLQFSPPLAELWAHGAISREVALLLISPWTAAAIVALALSVILDATATRASERAFGWLSPGLALLSGVTTLAFLLLWAGGVPVPATSYVISPATGVPLTLASAALLVYRAGGLLTGFPLDNTRPRTAEVRSLLDQSGTNRSAFVLGGAIVLGTVLIFGAAFAYLWTRETRARQDAERTLVSIGDLKLNRVNDWFEDELIEWDLAMEGRLPNDLVRSLARGRVDTEGRALLTAFMQARGYRRIELYDVKGRLLVTCGEGGGPRSPEDLSSLRDHGASILRDEMTGPKGLMEVAIGSRLHGDSEEPAGFLVGIRSAIDELIPGVVAWPFPSASADAYLVAREAQSVVFLTSVRFRPGIGGTRFPADDPTLSAARGARGESGPIEALDYRRIPVLSVIRKVDRLNWYLVVEMDRAEALEPAGADARLVGILAAVCLSTLGLAGMLVWRHRQADYLRLALTAEVESRGLSERLALISQNANDAILLFDRNMRIIDANLRAEDHYGRTASEMKALSAADLRAPSDRAGLTEQFQRILGGEASVFEALHTRADGTEFPVEVNSNPITIGGEPHVLSVIRDITERKAQEREIQRLTRLYEALAHLNQSAAQATSRETLLRDACRSLVEAGGFRMAWVGMPREDGRLVAGGVWGDDTAYVSKLNISLSDQATGRGPSGVAFREGRSVVANDFLNMAETAPWHEAARRAGFAASASLPVISEGRAVGVLAVYASEAHYFREAELALLDEAARDVAFGLERLEREAARERAESEARAAREQLEATVNAVPDLLFELSRDGQYLSFHSPRTDLLAAPPEVFLGKNVSEILPPDGAAVTARALSEADATGSSNGHQFRLDLPQGPAWFELSIAKAATPHGGEPRFVALSRDITDRKRAEQETLRSLREKEALLKEIHHRVKNNLQVITSLLRLEAARSKNPESRDILREMQNRIRSMALLHETLYQTGHFESVNLSDYFERLTGQLMRGQQLVGTSVRLDLKLAPVNVSLDQAIPCGLIVNELLTNSLKHAFAGRDAGRIELSLSREADGFIRIGHSDDGCGLPPDHNSRPGSLGMTLVADLSRQLRGELAIEPGPGARFVVRFPGDDLEQGATARGAS